MDTAALKLGNGKTQVTIILKGKAEILISDVENNALLADQK